MTDLSDKLAELSVRVGDIEARAEAFKRALQEKRDEEVAELKAKVQARQSILQETIASKGGEISSAWASLDQSIQKKAETVRNQIEAKKEAMDAGRAARRADRVEFNAAVSIEHAILAMEDAELALAEALDARIFADNMASAAEN